MFEVWSWDGVFVREREGEWVVGVGGGGGEGEREDFVSSDEEVPTEEGDVCESVDFVVVILYA